MLGADLRAPPYLLLTGSGSGAGTSNYRRGTGRSSQVGGGAGGGQAGPPRAPRVLGQDCRAQRGPGAGAWSPLASPCSGILWPGKARLCSCCVLAGGQSRCRARCDGSGVRGWFWGLGERNGTWGGACAALLSTQAHGPWWPWCPMSRAVRAQNKEDTAGSSADTEALEHLFGSGRMG